MTLDQIREKICDGAHLCRGCNVGLLERFRLASTAPWSVLRRGGWRCPNCGREEMFGPFKLFFSLVTQRWIRPRHFSPDVAKVPPDWAAHDQWDGSMDA